METREEVLQSTRGGAGSVDPSSICKVPILLLDAYIFVRLRSKTKGQCFR